MSVCYLKGAGRSVTLTLVFSVCVTGRGNLMGAVKTVAKILGLGGNLGPLAPRIF